MTREQIEAILAGCEGVTPGPWNYYTDARRAGAADMRERAAKWHDDEAARLSALIEEARIAGRWTEYADTIDDHENYAAAIRSIPIVGEGK